MTIVEFLLARIAETIATARAVQAEGVTEGLEVEDPRSASLRLARWAITDCEAKRRIVERCQHIIDNHVSDDFAADRLAEEILADLAAVYADHADYDPAWSPSN